MAQPPVYAAARNGQLERLQKLLDDGESPNTTFNDGWTPLHAAAYYGRTQAVRILLAHGAVIEAKLTNASSRPLHKACERGFTEIISILLTHGADIESRTKEGYTPLYVTARDDRPEAVQFLLNEGADPTARSNEGYTPLYVAAGKGCEEVVRQLVETGKVDVNTESDSGWTPLLFAARNGHTGTVRYLLEHGANGRAGNHEGWRPLHTAAYHGNLNVVEVLLGASQYGLEDEILRDGYRPLHKAVEKGFVEVMRVLLDAGARINAPDTDGYTPLHVAVKCDQLAAGRELLSRGASVDNQSYQAQRTPLHLAAQKGAHRMVSLLQASGADMNLQDKQGKTALSIARERNDEAVLNLLLDSEPTSYEEGSTLGVSGETMATTSGASSDGWFHRLDKLRRLLRAPPGDIHEPVRFAIIDSGVEPIHPHQHRIHSFRDFVSDSENREDKTGHGTTGLDLICKVIEKPAVYVARVFDTSAGSVDVQDRIAKAIEHARTVWKVDIITLASGFNQPHERMEQEIRTACSQGILIFAAASNSGNSQFITFPASLTSEVICMFATNANAKAITSSMNPSPSRKSPYNFAILGEEVVSRPRAKPQSGTSMSTFIGAATAGLMLEFSRQADVIDIIGLRRSRYLKSVRGMSAVFEEMAEGGHEGYHCMAPWKIRSVMEETPEREKRFIANVISAALDKCMV